MALSVQASSPATAGSRHGNLTDAPCLPAARPQSFLSSALSCGGLSAAQVILRAAEGDRKASVHRRVTNTPELGGLKQPAFPWPGALAAGWAPLGCQPGGHLRPRGLRASPVPRDLSAWCPGAPDGSGTGLLAQSPGSREHKSRSFQTAVRPRLQGKNLFQHVLVVKASHRRRPDSRAESRPAGGEKEPWTQV